MTESSTVCVSLSVEQLIWPAPVDQDTSRNLSGGFVAEMGRIFERRGGSRWMGEPGREPRFLANPRGTDVLCSDHESDIRMTASYRARADGTPFIFSYRIEQAGLVQEGREERDVFDEYRTGVRRTLNINEPVQTAILIDLSERAVELLNMVTG